MGSEMCIRDSSYRTFYVQEFAGINPETGNPLFYTNELDENGNYIKEITENSKNAQFIPYKHAEPTVNGGISNSCLLYTSPSPRDGLLSRMPSSA